MTADTSAFISCIICAAAMMALLDFFSCVRMKVIKSAATDFVMDIIWWVTAVAAVSFCLWETNSFSLRIYELIGASIGAASYKIIFSRLLKWIFALILGVIVKLFAVIIKLFKRILKILLTPALFLYKILMRDFKGLRQGGRK